MFTDGGSIPRIFWVRKSLSPWGLRRHSYSTTGSSIFTTVAKPIKVSKT